MGSILGNLRSGIRRLFTKGSSLIWSVGVKEVYNDIDVEKAISDGFNSNTAVYSIVMADATKFASIPRYLYDSKKSEQKAYNETARIEDNDLVKLLNRPNEYQSQDAFLTEVRAYFKVCGEAFIWLNRGDVSQTINEQGDLVDRESEAYMKMPVLEMYVLPSDKILIVPDQTNVWGISGYKLDVGGSYWPIRKEDVIHWKMPNLDFDPELRTHLRGKSPLSSGYKTLQQYNDATDASVRMYKNDGAKGVLFNETLDNLTPEQQTKIKNTIDVKINSNDIKGAVAALQGKWGYLQIGSSIDKTLLDAKQLTWKELCFLLKVPYNLFDPETNFSNTEWQQKNWINNTIIPDSKQLDGELNRVLLKAFGLENSAFIGCDYSELPELQDDLSKLTAALNTAWWLTGNEKRKIQNEEPVSDEMMNEILIPNGFTPLSQLNDAAEMQRISDSLRNDTGGNQGQDF